MRKFKNWTTNEKHLALAGIVFFIAAVGASIGWVATTQSAPVGASPTINANADTAATWVGVGVAALALWFARSAWREARDANGIAMSQLEKSVEGVEDQIEAQRKTALEQMQLEQLGKYCEALISYANNARHIPEDIRPYLESGEIVHQEDVDRAFDIEKEERKREIRARWTSWAMYVIGDDPTLREATGRHLASCIAETEAVLNAETTRLLMDSFNPNAMRASMENLAIVQRLEVLLDETASFVTSLQQVMLRAAGWKEIRLELVTEYSTKSN